MKIGTWEGAALPRALRCPPGLTPRRPATDVEPLCRMTTSWTSSKAVVKCGWTLKGSRSDRSSMSFTARTEDVPLVVELRDGGPLSEIISDGGSGYLRRRGRWSVGRLAGEGGG